MGCEASKPANSLLLKLCKERKELIMAAAECRYALASSHVLYLRALLDVADALSQFVDEGIVTEDCLEPECNNECLNLTSDDDESLSSLSKDAHLTLSDSDSDSDSDCESSSSHIVFDELESLGFSPLTAQFHTGTTPNVSRLRFSAPALCKVYEHLPVYPVTVEAPFDSMNVPLDNLIHPLGKNGSSFNAPMISSLESTGHHHGADGASLTTPINFPSNDPRFPSYGYGASNVPSNCPSKGGRFRQYAYGKPLGGSSQMWDHVPYDNLVRRTPVPMPPQPEFTSWDYFDPFTSTREMFPHSYSQVRYDTESSSDIPGLSEVRQRKGIPELEDKLERQVKRGSGNGVSGSAPLINASVTEVAPSEELKSGSNATEGIADKKNATEGIQDEANTAEGASSDVLESKTMEDEHDMKKEKTLREVVKGIRKSFYSTFNYGIEVSMLLEADKLPYQYKGSTFKVTSCLQTCVGPSTPTHLPSRESSFRSFKIAHATKKDLDIDVHIKSGSLSSTFDKLCAWDKRLYEEVKDEEKHRVLYDKDCKKLEYLTKKGAESSKIDALSVSVERLLLRIKVSVTYINAISRRINKEWEENLLQQLSELIQGLMRLWTFMAEFHKIQLQEIMVAKCPVQVASCEITGSLGLRATMKLEMECLKWAKCFRDWINAQKSFAKFLNAWLFKCITREETTGGHFSPGRVGAPDTFTVCKDWYQAVEKMSETEVSKAIHDFASSLNLLRKRQSEEQNERAKAESLSKDYKRAARSFKELKASRDRNATAAGGVAGLDDLEKKLQLKKKRLDMQKTRHGKAVKDANDAASNALKSGMISIFEALESFCLERVKDYKQIRNSTSM